MLLIAGCVSQPKVCELAPVEDGWQYLDEKPKDISYKISAGNSRVVYWFKKRSGLVIACERSVTEPGCGEVATLFSRNNGNWESTVPEVIVCGG
ncbi:hypothetical protein NBRC116493_30340 [Aurantivibrio infirmus]